MTRIVTKLGEFDLGQGLTLIKENISGSYQHSNQPYSYDRHDLETELSGIELLSALAAVLKRIPEDGALDFDEGDLEEYLKDWAAETAEYAELPFTYEDSLGKVNTYTPASLWEASGGCEWEESAQVGYDYGWNI